MSQQTKQTLFNPQIGNYPVLITQLADLSQVQSVNAILPFISHLDDQGTGTIYTGYALRGTADGAARWFIMQSVKSAGITTIRFASEPFTMNQIWDNRASLAYT